MHRIDIKPLTVNQAHRTVNGRILKSSAYRGYEQTLFYLLPIKKIPKGKLFLEIKVGLSSKLSDVDNVVKPFVDILQKKYNFNDRMIYKLHIEKTDVPKKKEFIEFKINELN